MINVGWIAGWMERSADRRGLIVHQGSRKEFGVPIGIRDGETIKPGYKDGSPVKVTCRISGEFLKERGERIAVLRMLNMDNPTVLDMQPYERRRAASKGDGADEPTTPAAPAPTAAAADAKPKQHRVLLPEGIKARLSGSANFVRLAGYVGGVHVEPGKLHDDGRPGEPCLVILLRQDDNPDHAIPVRCYNRLAEAIADKLPIGIPIIINDGEIKIRVVPTGEPAGEDGVVPTYRYPFIKARVPQIASQDHILVQPRWAEELLIEYRKAKARRAVKVRSEGEPAPGGNGSAEPASAEDAAAPAPEVAPSPEAAVVEAPAAKPAKKSLAAIAPE
jgi:hypothetical protein